MATIYDCLKPVKSSMFSRAGYNEATWQLLLEFQSTKEIKAYKGVSPEVADEAMSAKSLGQWWNQNVRNNAGWEYEVLGADPSQVAPEPKKPAVEGGISDDDIRIAEPGWNGSNIDGIPMEMVGLEPTTADTYGGIERGSIEIPSPSHNSTPGGKAPNFGVEKFDPHTGHRPNSEMNEDGTVNEFAITTQPTAGEVLPAWHAPESAAEALDLLSERDGEIRAIIAQNKTTGEQALTVRVNSAEKRAEASETLNRLVLKKDTTTAALDPFRKVLYDAYTEAGEKVKSGITPLEVGIKHVKGQILAWDQDRERERRQLIREENNRREAEAKRLQEEDAARIKLADVQDALDAGDEKRAETLFEAPAEAPKPYVPPAYIPPPAPKIEGQSTSTKWKVDEDLIEDDQAYTASIVALMRAVIAGKYDMQQAAALLKWDLSAANKLAGALGASFNVPGLSVKEVGSLSVRRKKK
jgi:hypothetical protein